MRQTRLKRLALFLGCGLGLLLSGAAAAQAKPEIIQLPLEGEILAVLGPLDLSKCAETSFDISPYGGRAKFVAIRVTTQPDQSWVPDDDLPVEAAVQITLQAGGKVVGQERMSLEDWIRRPCAFNLYERCLCRPLAEISGAGVEHSKTTLAVAVVRPIHPNAKLRYDVILLSR